MSCAEQRFFIEADSPNQVRNLLTDSNAKSIVHQQNVDKGTVMLPTAAAIWQQKLQLPNSSLLISNFATYLPLKEKTAEDCHLQIKQRKQKEITVEERQFYFQSWMKKEISFYSSMQSGKLGACQQQFSYNGFQIPEKIDILKNNWSSDTQRFEHQKL